MDVYSTSNSFNHKHSIYLEGGTPNLRYGVDGSFNIADGVMKGTERNRYSAGFSLDYRIKNLQVRNYVSFGHTKSKESPYGSFSDLADYSLMTLLIKMMEHSGRNSHIRN